ncbi:unnamed protein product [Zymoseptoria tritici ST99CH_1E4]|uniref:Transcription factor domain-containing protein n=1 Tax=Zymoseptoria tritici ST99CH_1E4 TaxID=1276532 RepID=A0A2H1GXF6_ZYMTR|nr:unnamed protein product [Zymoseptoria tritici ST99CH_1E4]
MDTTVCMTLGRPPTFTAVEDIPVPSAVDLAQFSPAGDSLDSDPLICNFFVQNSRAARMLGKILHRVYHPSLSTVSKASARSTQLPAAADALSAILGLHSELNDLASSSLSALELCVDQGSRANMVVERQRNVLNSRFLHMRVLLHRPCFTSFCSLARSGDHQTSTGEDDSFPVDDLPACMVQQSAFICVRTACELALSLQKATQEQATGAWWYSLFYIITCAVIVILTECTPRLVRRLAVGELDAAWSACLEVLENMGSGHSLPGQYIHSLKVLRSRGRMRSGEVYPPGEKAPRPADFRNTIDPLLHSQNVDQNLQVAHSMSQQDMLQYADYQNDDGNFFLPAFFGEWGADINSIIM